MKFLAPIFLLLAASTTAASVTLYNHKHCNKPGIGICRNLPVNSCCSQKGVFFSSAKAKGIPDAAIFGSTKGSVCSGKLTAHRTGPGCITSHGGAATGAVYHHASKSIASRSAAVEFAETECAGSVLPDVAIIDGRYFEVNYHVPKNESAELWTLAQSKAAYADIPEKLMRWETAL